MPLKFNTVVVRGFNEDDVIGLARLSIDKPWQIRFIEMLPFAGATDLQLHQSMKSEEIIARIEASLGSLVEINEGNLEGEARLYQLPGAQGRIGFISTVSQPFCELCTRARLTADGRLRLCLLREGEVDLLTPLRAGVSFDELRHLVIAGIWEKPWGHGLAEGEIPLNRGMSEIGG